MRRVFLGLLVYGIIGTTRMIGQQPPDQSADEAAIRKAATSYMEAFNKHDAKALADLWSPDAVYLNRTTGEEVVGREAIVEQFAALFKEQPEVKLQVNVASVQFVSPNVAIERGTAKFLSPNAEPDEIESGSHRASLAQGRQRTPGGWAPWASRLLAVSSVMRQDVTGPVLHQMRLQNPQTCQPCLTLLWDALICRRQGLPDCRGAGIPVCRACCTGPVALGSEAGRGSRRRG